MVCFWQQPTGHVIGSRDLGGLEAVITRYWIVVTFKCDGYGDIWHFINVRRGQKVKGQGQHHLKGRLWAFLALALYDEIFLYVRPHQIWTNAYSQHRDWSRNACPFLKRFLRTLERRSNLAEVWSWKVQKVPKCCFAYRLFGGHGYVILFVIRRWWALLKIGLSIGPVEGAWSTSKRPSTHRILSLWLKRYGRIG